MQVRYQAALRPDVSEIARSIPETISGTLQYRDDFLNLFIESHRCLDARLRPFTDALCACFELSSRSINRKTILTQELFDSQDKLDLISLVIPAILPSTDIR